MSPTEVELVKYAKNSFITMKVIFGNTFNVLQIFWSRIGVVRKSSPPAEAGIVDSHLDEIDGKMGYGGVACPRIDCD